MERPSRRIRSIRMTEETTTPPPEQAPAQTQGLAVPPKPRERRARLWVALLLLAAACCASLAWWAAAQAVRGTGADINDVVVALGVSLIGHLVDWATEVPHGIALAMVAVSAVLLKLALMMRRTPPTLAATVHDVPAATLAAARAMLAAQQDTAAPTRARTLKEVALLTEELSKYREGHVDAGVVMQGNDVALLPLLLALMLHPAMRAAHADPALRLKAVEERLPAEGLKVPRHALLSMVRLALL